MSELNITVFDHGEEEIAILRKVIADFVSVARVKVNLDVLPWLGGWEHMVNIALNRVGPDISEIGTTWIGDFVKMNALANFNVYELHQIGKPDEFVPESWASVTTPTSPTNPTERVWAVPWVGDTRTVFYRKDILKRHGIDPATAFTDHNALIATLETLKAGGEPFPISLTTQRSRICVHNIASYVWGLGGSFTAKGEKKVLLDSAEVFQGFTQYLQLGKYLSTEARNISDMEADALFIQRKAAVMISGYWILNRSMALGFGEQVGMAAIPGVPFVGGMNLAVWQHSRQKRNAIRFIKHITGTKTAGILFPAFGIPVRKDHLDTPPYSTDKNFRVLRDSMLRGRSFSSEYLWGLIEKRLTDLIPIIWEEYLKDPAQEIEPLLEKYILPLNRRLNLTLQS